MLLDDSAGPRLHRALATGLGICHLSGKRYDDGRALGPPPLAREPPGRAWRRTRWRATHIVSAAQILTKYGCWRSFPCARALHMQRSCTKILSGSGPCPWTCARGEKTTRWWPTARNFTCQAIAPLLAPRTTKIIDNSLKSIHSDHIQLRAAFGERREQDEKSRKNNDLHGPVFTRKSRYRAF